VLGAELTIKVASRDTDNAFTVFEGWTNPLQGPPLHVHRDQDEWWYILDGEFLFEVGGQEIHARTGDVVFAPRGIPHTFQNVGATPGHTLTSAVPGGMDEFFEALEMAAPRGSVPDPAKLDPVCEKYGQAILGPSIGARAGGKPAASAIGAGGQR
jgi:mannose-6-phosphate isomerase-like protein (cupin superfamily)